MKSARTAATVLLLLSIAAAACRSNKESSATIVTDDSAIVSSETSGTATRATTESRQEESERLEIVFIPPDSMTGKQGVERIVHTTVDRHGVSESVAGKSRKRETASTMSSGTTAEKTAKQSAPPTNAGKTVFMVITTAILTYYITRKHYKK